MYHDIDRLGTDKTIGHVQVSAESITLGSPRVLRDIIFRSVLILGDAGKVHQMVISRDERLEAFLTDLRGDVYFRGKVSRICRLPPDVPSRPFSQSEHGR